MPTINLFGVPVVLLSQIGDIFIDALEEVTITEESLVTKHPVETGSNISDHVVNLPVTITMSGRFADAPLSTGGVSFFNPLQAVSTLASSGLTAGLSVTRWGELEQLRARRTLFDVTIQQGLYQNMVFKTLVSPRGKGDGTSLRFRVDLQQIVQPGEAEDLTASGVLLESLKTTLLGPQALGIL